jgi:hypothetical protein
MKEPLKYFLERTTPFGALTRFQRQRRLRKKLHLWEKSGCIGSMPNLGKQQVVIEYIKKFSPSVFIETGTYKGKMIYAVLPHVKQIFSIELDYKHYLNAQRRFAGYPGIHIIHGESGHILPQLLDKMAQPCLFWLDAHWSGGSTARGDLQTPIMQELECILNHIRADDHVILIDDARLFVGANDYPTIEVMKEFILRLHPDWTFELKNDIVRTHLKNRI